MMEGGESMERSERIKIILKIKNILKIAKKAGGRGVQ